MERASNYFDDDYIPGTTTVFTSNDACSVDSKNLALKRNKRGVILMPQPTNSPNDPLNWLGWRKAWHTAILCVITGLTAAIANDAGAAQDSLNQIYGISYDAMNTGAGVLFLFIGWSCIFLAPASSLYGRRISYLFCLVCGVLGSVWFALSRRTADTTWSQAIVGISEACAEAQVQQSISDIFFQHQLGLVLTIYILATSTGSFLGPLFAHLIAEEQTFRWVGWWGAIITGGLLIVVLVSCEETVFDRSAYSTVFAGADASPQQSVASGKEKNTGSSSGDNSLVFANEKDHIATIATTGELKASVANQPDEPKNYWARVAIVTPSPYLVGYGFKQYIQRFFLYFKVFGFPAVWLSGILWGLQDAYMTFFLTTQDTYFSEDPWNYSETGIAIMNVATLVGSILGCLMSGLVSDYHVLYIAKRKGGILEPEYRLWLLFVTLVVSPLGLILFGVGADRSWNPVAIYAGLGMIGFGWGLIGDTAMSYLMDCYPGIVIQGMVCVLIINNTLACIFTFVCLLWLDSAGTANTYIALAVIDFVSIACIVPTLYWGKTWRKRSKGLYVSLMELTQGMG